jgi:hypothetical protein
MARTVRNCRPIIAAPCPRKWEALVETSDDAVRHCSTCAKPVFFCATDEETLAHARAGDCVAREVPDRGNLGPIVVGRPRMPIVATPDQLANRARVQRERGIDDILAWDLAAYARDCPACDWPVPSFRVTCKVCGAAVGRLQAEG